MSGVMGISKENIAQTAAMFIDDARLSMFFLEFIQNAIEHDATECVIGSTRVDGVRKLCIKNNGVGLSKSDMTLRLCDLFSSSKKTHIDHNRGAGARLTGLKASPCGVVYRSCHHGKAYELRLWRDQNGVIHYSDVKRSRIKSDDLSHDWVKAIFMGESPDHDTVSKPYDGATKSAPIQAARDIVRGIWRLPENFKVIDDIKKCPKAGRVFGTAWASVKSLDGVDTVVSPDGINYHFIDLRKITREDRATPQLRNIGVATDISCPTGVIYKNRLFNIKPTFSKWRTVAPRVGLDLVARSVMVAIELPDTFPVSPDLNRTDLTWDKTVALYDSSKSDSVEMIDFAQDLQAYFPDWVSKLIDDERKKFSSAGDADKRFNNLMKEFAVYDEFLTPEKDGDVTGDETDIEGGGEGESGHPIKKKKKILASGKKKPARKKQLPRKMPDVMWRRAREHGYDTYFANGSGNKPLQITPGMTMPDTFHVNMEYSLFHGIEYMILSLCEGDPMHAERVVQGVLQEMVIEPYASTFYVTCHISGVLNDSAKFTDIAINHDCHLGMAAAFIANRRDIEKEILRRLEKLGHLKTKAA